MAKSDPVVCKSKSACCQRLQRAVQPSPCGSQNAIPRPQLHVVHSRSLDRESPICGIFGAPCYAYCDGSCVVDGRSEWLRTGRRDGSYRYRYAAGAGHLITLRTKPSNFSTPTAFSSTTTPAPLSIVFLPASIHTLTVLSVMTGCAATMFKNKADRERAGAGRKARPCDNAIQRRRGRGQACRC